LENTCRTRRLTRRTRSATASTGAALLYPAGDRGNIVDIFGKVKFLVRIAVRGGSRDSFRKRVERRFQGGEGASPAPLRTPEKALIRRPDSSELGALARSLLVLGARQRAPTLKNGEFSIVYSHKHLLAYYVGYWVGGIINRIALLAMLVILVVIMRRWFQEPTRRETMLFKAAIVIAAIVGDLLGTPLSNFFWRQP
jgi:hypothetical protein